MSKVIIPFILFGEQGGVLWPAQNRRGDRELFDKIGWDPLGALPSSGLVDAGYCRCGKGMMVFYWPEIKALSLKAKTILRCHDRQGQGCKFRIALPGVIRTYGGLLLALQDENSAAQAELMDTLIKDWLSAVAARETELQSNHCHVAYVFS